MQSNVFFGILFLKLADQEYANATKVIFKKECFIKNHSNGYFLLFCIFYSRSIGIGNTKITRILT